MIATTAEPSRRLCGRASPHHPTTPRARTRGQTGLNNNVLVLGCSGAGKTRNHPQAQPAAVPWLLRGTRFQRARSYYEMAPYLARPRLHGRPVSTSLAMERGAIGYDPLRHVRWRLGPSAARRTSLPWQAPSVRQTRWTATRFGLALPPTTLQATSPMSLRHCPNANATWPRLCVFSSRPAKGAASSELFEDLEHDRTRKAMPSRSFDRAQAYGSGREDAFEHHGHHRREYPDAVLTFDGAHAQLSACPSRLTFASLGREQSRALCDDGRPRPQPCPH